jgi:hypothetical protein
MLPQSIEENLSVAYAYAVASRAGAPCEIIKQDYGVDISVRRLDKIRGQIIDMGAAFDCQLKATIDYEVKSDTVLYDMAAPAYNKLVWRNRNSSTPQILVVLCLPKDESEWLDLSSDGLVIRRCSYWTLDFSRATKNSKSFRIQIPQSQMFTPDCISDLIAKVKRREI